jgi:hypothetical protein
MPELDRKIILAQIRPRTAQPWAEQQSSPSSDKLENILLCALGALGAMKFLTPRPSRALREK